MAKPSGRRLVLALAFLAFVSLGLPDGVPGVAWPSIRHTFGLPIDRLGELLACGVGGYLVSSMGAGAAVRRWGVGILLTASTFLVAGALIGYALAPTWGLMLVLAVFLGLGSGAIDAAINTFAAAAFSPRIVTWLHACFGVGAMLGPLVMTAAITNSHANWRWGYAALAIALAGMATAFSLTSRLWRAPAGVQLDPAAASAGELPPEAGATIAATLSRPVVWLQLLLFFVYTGTEMSAGQWLYSLLIWPTRGFDEVRAGWVVSGFWASLTVGRIAFGQLAAKVPALLILRAVFGVAPLGAALLCWRTSPLAAVAGACLLGLALAPVFPLLISLTPARVGHRHAANAVGFQVSAATLGIAAWPALMGLLAHRFSLELLGPYLLIGTLALIAIHEAVVKTARLSAAAAGR